MAEDLLHCRFARNLQHFLRGQVWSWKTKTEVVKQKNSEATSQWNCTICWLICKWTYIIHHCINYADISLDQTQGLTDNIFRIWKQIAKKQILQALEHTSFKTNFSLNLHWHHNEIFWHSIFIYFLTTDLINTKQGLANPHTAFCPSY